MEKRNKYFKIAGIVIFVVVLLLASVIGYKKYEEKKIAEEIAEHEQRIGKEFSDFSKEADRTKKVELLKKEIQLLESYKKEDSHYPEVVSAYDKTIENMRKFFKDEYTSEIKKLEIAEADSVQDKELFKTTTDSLTQMLAKIKSEKEIISTEKEIQNYETQITGLTTKYGERIKAIEEEEKRKAEEEAARKAEEERLVKEEAERKRQQTNSQRANNGAGSNASAGNTGNASSAGSSSGNSANGDSGAASSNSSGNGSGGKYVTYTNKHYINGVHVSTTYTYSDGSMVTVDEATGESTNHDDYIETQ